MLAATSQSFADLFREHAPHAGRALRNLGVSEPDVPDALQETFLVVHRKLSEFRGDSSVRTWIYGICLRVAAAHRRRPHRRREVGLDEADDRATDRTPHDDAEQRQALTRLDEVLDGLDDDKRAAFVLYEIEELTLAEIAEAVGAPLPTVYSRLKAARKAVEEAFATDRSAAEEGQSA